MSPLTNFDEYVSDDFETKIKDYQRDSLVSIGQFTWKYYQYEAELVAGVIAISTGLGLLIFGGNRNDDDDFWSKVLKFFTKV